MPCKLKSVLPYNKEEPMENLPTRQKSLNLLSVSLIVEVDEL
jgi:hypothetical protein